MTNQSTRLGFMYIGTRPCGCVSAMAWDDAGYEKQTAKLVSEIIKRGDSVTRIERFEGDPLPSLHCATHATEQATGNQADRFRQCHDHAPVASTEVKS